MTNSRAPSQSNKASRRLSLLSGLSLVCLFVAAIAAIYYLRRAGLGSAPAQSPPVAAGTQAMVERLRELAKNSDPAHNVYLNRQRAALFRDRLARAVNPVEKLDARIRLSLELLQSGDTETAIHELHVARDLMRVFPEEQRPGMALELDRLFAQAHLRLGEQQNCVARHTSQSCLLPLQEGGVHEIQTGSRQAVQYLNRILERAPGDIESVWLLNVAHMTLGEYPDQVSPSYLIPPEVFASDYDIRRFRDVAPQVGVAAAGTAGGAIMEDFDGDGWLDVVCSSWGMGEQLRFFRNQGDGTFEERTREAGLSGLTGGLNLLQADYDNDGHRDILVLRGAWMGREGRHPNSLLRNRGDGTFVDVTEEAGLLSFHPTQTAVWTDFDLDGRLDLFVGNESGEDGTHPCELFHNQGDGTFRDVAADYGVAHVGFVKGVAAGDYDNDGRPDLYLSCFGEPNVLFRNAAGKEPGTSMHFEDVTARAGVAEPVDSFPTWFFDVDNDGWEDLWVASYSDQASMAKVAADYLDLPDNPGARPRLYRNNGDGTFTDITAASRLDRVLVVMGCNFGDLDNDGWLDFYLGTGDPVLTSLMPNRMFRNADGKFFQDVTTSGGFGHVQKGHGVAFGDFDHDGDQDVFARMGGAYEGDAFQCALFENPGHGNHWVTLELRGRSSNRDAIGARISLVVRGEEGSRIVHATVSSGGSFGASSVRQEIGLGRATAIESLRVQWPNSTGTSQIFTNVPLNAAVEIVEGAAEVQTVPRQRIHLGAAQR